MNNCNLLSEIELLEIGTYLKGFLFNLDFISVATESIET